LQAAEYRYPDFCVHSRVYVYPYGHKCLYVYSHKHG
jgi:hypothetical protein